MLQRLPSVLGGQQARPSVVRTLSGASTHLSGNGATTLQLSGHTALVLDSSCTDVTFRNLTIAGVCMFMFMLMLMFIHSRKGFLLNVHAMGAAAFSTASMA